MHSTVSGRDLPLTTRFELGTEISSQQWAFLDEYGFLIFKNVASQEECDLILEEAERLNQEWNEQRKSMVFGVPLFRGNGLNGEDFVSRLPFTSVFSAEIHKFIRDERFQPILDLIGKNARIGDREKDGVVINRFINVPGSAYPRLGWHTDGLRDLAYLRMPKRMLNIGLHFDRITEADGGLRLIPGSHKQGFREMCFKKLYFLDHRPDPDEVVIETEPGDLTIHDGRLWHRVQQSPYTGERSLRRSMYLPYLSDEYQPKSESSKTPVYHYIGMALRRMKRVAGKGLSL